MKCLERVWRHKSASEADGSRHVIYNDTPVGILEYLSNTINESAKLWKSPFEKYLCQWDEWVHIF